jgi:DNA-binding transcriptional regulator YdaS (Cro superfamily)
MFDLIGTIKEKRGTISAIARECSVTPGAVSQWLQSRIPAERVLHVERATGISRCFLRPDLYPPASSAGVPAGMSSADASTGAGYIAPAGGEDSRMEAAE